jgi:hypothetical protein
MSGRWVTGVKESQEADSKNEATFLLYLLVPGIIPAKLRNLPEVAQSEH